MPDTPAISSGAESGKSSSGSSTSRTGVAAQMAATVTPRAMNPREPAQKNSTEGEQTIYGLAPQKVRPEKELVERHHRDLDREQEQRSPRPASRR